MSAASSWLLVFCGGVAMISLSLILVFNEIPEDSANHIPVVSPTTRGRLVKCLDVMHQEKQADIKKHLYNRKIELLSIDEHNNGSITIPTDSLYFVFIGDSRIRQIFLLFLEHISQFDLRSEPLYEQTFRRVVAHEDVFVYSEIFRLAATYHWSGEDNLGHNLEGLITHLLNAMSYPKDEYTFINRSALNLRPDFVLIGVSTHFMLPMYKDHEKDYVNRLSSLQPLLREFSEKANLVWLAQFPVFENYAKNGAHNTYVHTEKIMKYNKIAEKILSGGIEIWNHGIPWVAEYVRSCSTNLRIDAWPNGHFICGDFIHPGTSALKELIQLYINKICSPLGDY